jgi:putative transposase
MNSNPQFFDPHGDTEAWGNRLPHWQQAGATYFLTFRQYDSLPKQFEDRWLEERRIWLINNPEPWSRPVEQEYHSLFTWRIEKMLDKNHGTCILRDPGCRQIVENCLMFREGVEYRQYSWVIMPNHVHLLVSIYPAFTLSWELNAWKGVTSHRLNKRLGREGTFWQGNYRDTIVRDLKHFGNCVRYIRNNPGKAGLGEGEYTLYESEEARGIE